MEKVRLTEDGYIDLIIDTDTTPTEWTEEFVEFDEPDRFRREVAHCYKRVGDRYVLDDERASAYINRRNDGERVARYHELLAAEQERETAQRLIQSTDDADMLITLMPGMFEWDGVSTYKRGDCRTHSGMPYRALHDINAPYNAQPPPELPTLWTLLHGRTPVTALPFVAEGHNPYMAGEWALWGGAAYECLADDVVHSPADRPGAWRASGTGQEDTDAESDKGGDTGGETGEPTIPPYATGVYYQVGDIFVYNGKTYRAIQAHTSQASWPPDALPALYALV